MDLCRRVSGVVAGHGCNRHGERLYGFVRCAAGAGSWRKRFSAIGVEDCRAPVSGGTARAAKRPGGCRDKSGAGAKYPDRRSVARALWMESLVHRDRPGEFVVALAVDGAGTAFRGSSTCE